MLSYPILSYPYNRLFVSDPNTGNEYLRQCFCQTSSDGIRYFQ